MIAEAAMEKFKPLDFETYKRKEHFEHYLKSVPCTYSMTVMIDISNIKKRGIKLYPAMLYCLTRAVNLHEEFRTSFDQNGRVGVFETMNPSYTVFHEESGTFSSIWSEFKDDFAEFSAVYSQDVELYGSKEGFFTKPNAPDNLFNVSMVPWETFGGFNLNLSDFTYLLPIFTLGRFYEQGGKTLMPLAAQVHHAVCDGYHLHIFLDDLREQIAALKG